MLDINIQKLKSRDLVLKLPLPSEQNFWKVIIEIYYNLHKREVKSLKKKSEK